jgi:hypothetical protein
MMPPQTQESLLDNLARRFVRFAQRECAVSPLYARLAQGIAQDPAVLSIAAQARPDQPLPNLFLAAVHFLLLQRPRQALAVFYPNLSAGNLVTGDPYPSFRAFCLAHAEAIRLLIATRLVQTNEVRRCACLLPAFALIAARTEGRPLALVEIGTSAGFNLFWDRYGYDYGDGRRYGDTHSPVQLTCRVLGALHPPLPMTWPTVATRVGLDLHPLDVGDPDAALWLQALVWPDEAGRAELLKRALEMIRRNPPRLVGGDALDRLPAVLATVPDKHVLCVFHTHTINQFSVEARGRLSEILAARATTRDLYRVSIEWLGTEHPHLELGVFEHGQQTAQLLAHCGSHGEWIQWLSATSTPG